MHGLMFAKKNQETAGDINHLCQNRPHSSVALFYGQKCLVFGSFLVSQMHFLNVNIVEAMFSKV
jgi:hypothetical protein